MAEDDAAENPIGLLVLGMHRSGTSAVTGLLDKLGVPVAGELLLAETYNEKGLFENKAVNLFHVRLLEHLGSSWDDPVPLSNDFVATRAGRGFVRELSGIIKTELLRGAPIFAVKDPRMCRFLPLWQAALARRKVDPKAIIVLRHPVDAAGSLTARDKFPRAKSFLLWLDHMLAAEYQTRGMARSVVSYDDLLADWRGVAGKLAAELAIRWPKERGRVENEIDQFLSADLRHHRSRGEIGAATELDALVARSFDALQSLVADATNADALTTLDEARTALNSAAQVFSPYVAWEFRALKTAEVEVDRLQFQEIAIRKERTEFETAIREQHDDYTASLRENQDSFVTSLRKEHDEYVASLREKNDEYAGSLRKTLTTEQRSFRRTLNESIQKLDASEQMVALLRHQIERSQHFEAEASVLRMRAHDLQVTVDAIRASTSWRLFGPIRRMAGVLPPPVKLGVRRVAKAGWWAITPWRMGARFRHMEMRRRLAEEASAALQAAEAARLQSESSGSPAARPMRRGASTQPPLGVFEVPGGQNRVSMVTDSINAGSLFGGVATALIFTALLAKRTNRQLRIVTRMEAPAAENVAVVFRAHGIEWADNIEFAFADIHDESSVIDTHADDVFVTTSWWTTQATRQSVPNSRILYILQEDERMFYPYGDDLLACSEVIGDRSIRKLINSELLHRHLKADGIVDDQTPFFEPAFPDRIYYPEPDPNADKRKFFFYARPNNARNLYERGVSVIEAALERGILDADLWDIYFVGKDLAPVQLRGGVAPILLQNLAWGDYAAFVRSVDLALTLMYTPHPSYPPLDVAACGGVAVTNSFGVKTDLARYSRSIICVDSGVDALLEGLRQGIHKAADREGREKALADSGIGRDWAVSFEPVFDRLVMDGRLVH